MRQRRQLGYAPATISARDISICSGGLYWLWPTCWGYSQDAWNQMGEFPTPPAPVPYLPPPSNTPPGSAADAQAAIDSALDANKTAANAQMQAFFNNVPLVPDSSSNTWLYLGLGIVGVLGLAALGKRL